MTTTCSESAALSLGGVAGCSEKILLLCVVRFVRVVCVFVI